MANLVVNSTVGLRDRKPRPVTVHHTVTQSNTIADWFAPPVLDIFKSQGC